LALPLDEQGENEADLHIMRRLAGARRPRLSADLSTSRAARDALRRT
jgi:hypothetical protein